MRVIGTAGHVDHGKSTLVEALTGIHPDRLKEEREREMTIDLGFAWMTLPNGEEVGIVDVPGHRDFIENMLAGVGGIDAVLFVVAADEGVMPQTREHLAILDILQVQGGVVALTKIDLVEDPEWLNLIEEDLGKVLAGSVLAEAPILRVSARSRQGLPELVSALQSCISNRQPRPDNNRARLPVDRVFSMVGFGTVVTGTLIDGHFQVGDEVEILPQNLRGRVRGLQTHKHKEEIAAPGSRTAINITGVNVEQIRRGNIVCHPGEYRTTRRLDVRFRLLKNAGHPLEHNIEVKVYLGTAEVTARLRLLGKETLLPGEEGWLQLELVEPVVAVRGDRYILRRPSPGETLGGGIVVDPNPPGRHKRFDNKNLEHLNALGRGTPAEILLQALIACGAAPLSQVILRSNLGQAADSALEELTARGQIVDLEGKGHLSVNVDFLVASQGWWIQVREGTLSEVDKYHKVYPLKKGMPREELKSHLKSMLSFEFSPRLFTTLLHKLVLEGYIQENGLVVHRPGYTIQFNENHKHAIASLMARFAASPYAPPNVKDCQEEVGEDIFTALVEEGRLILVAPDIVFRCEDYEQMKLEVKQVLEAQGTVSAAQVRDHFGTSRRYVLALLEYLDAIGFTIRKGDIRRLKA
jgi:selenocysteine-specific elongation factor